MAEAESQVPKPRTSSAIIKRGYSDDEIMHIYALGRFLLENGDSRKAEVLFHGINEIAPEYLPAWLGSCVTNLLTNNKEAAVQCARQALKADEESIEAMLYLSCALLSAEDFNSAGSYLGEVGERIEAGGVDDPQLVRFFKIQLARYQNR